MLSAAQEGFLLGLSLIVAIGAQNLFVLRQGLKHEHALAVAFTCSFIDSVLIYAGVAGVGSLIAQNASGQHHYQKCEACDQCIMCFQCYHAALLT